MNDLFGQFIKVNREMGGTNFFIAENEYLCRGPEDCGKKIRLDPRIEEPIEVICPRCNFPQTITPRKNKTSF